MMLCPLPPRRHFRFSFRASVRRTLVIAPLAALLLAAPRLAAQAEGEPPAAGDVTAEVLRSKMGQNISGLNDYERQRVYINAAKTARPFGTVEKPWDPDAGRKNLGPDGWPAGDFGMTMFTEGTSSWNGVYKFSARGRIRKVEIVSSPCRIVPGSFRYDESTGRTHADIQCTVVGAQTAQMHLRFLGTEGGLKDVKLIRPGYSEGDDETQVFTREFLGLLRHLRAGVIRGMDWQRINGTAVSKWSERATRNDPTYSDRPGAPLEDLVLLCNIAGADLWLNIPHMADDDYVRQAALLARDTLDEKLAVWVEYSNEVWNFHGSFPQSKWNQQKANEEFAAGDARYHPTNATMRGWQRTGKRTVEIGQVFKQVFAEKGQQHRVRVVLAGQAGYPEVLETAANWITDHAGPVKSHVCAIAVAPYFGSDKYWDVRTDLTVDSYLAPGYTWEVDRRDANGRTIKDPATGKPLRETRTEAGVYLMDRAEGVMRGPKLKRFFDLARREGVRATCYEMGLGLGDSNASKEAKIAVNRDPRLRAPTERYLDLWFETAPDVADVACWFTAASRWHAKGSYGATDDAGNVQAPKVQAIAAVAAKHPHEPAAKVSVPAPQPGPDTQPGPGQSGPLRRAIDEVEAATQKLHEADAEFRAKWELLKQTASQHELEAAAPE